MAKRRVVITGLGVISPVGNSIKTAWENILAGRSGIAPITNFDASDFSVRFAGEIRDFEVSDYIPSKEARRMGTFIHYGIAAASQAIEDSGIEITDANAARAGVAIGSGIGGLQGKTSDIEIHAKEMVKTRDILYEILAKHTSKEMKQIHTDCDRDYYMSASEAREYKLIDNVLEKRKMSSDKKDK